MDIKTQNKNVKIAVIGMGYVGLPLSVEFSKYFTTVGFDISSERVSQLNSGIDVTNEILNLEKSESLLITSNVEDISNCNFYVVTVPTPIDLNNQPDLSPLRSACETVGKYLSNGDIVVFESTVYPGCTEEFCVPILETVSGRSYNKEFFCGYSPERINPGDKSRSVNNIVKVTSGSTYEVAKFIDDIYKTIILAGTFPAQSIKVAEAAKVIENTQRDLNIALMNELAIIFSKLNISTEAVLEAAGSKWNFANYRPGLVGGHCIGVDPYYLTYKAQSIGYQPEIILSGRRLNDGMAKYVGENIIKGMVSRRLQIHDSNILIMGFAFKENCNDIRNTKVADLVETLKQYYCNVHIYDPLVDSKSVLHEYGYILTEDLLDKYYDAVVVAVPHQEIINFGTSKIEGLGKQNALLYDVKYAFPESNKWVRL